MTLSKDTIDELRANDLLFKRIKWKPAEVGFIARIPGWIRCYAFTELEKQQFEEGNATTAEIMTKGEYLGRGLGPRVPVESEVRCYSCGFGNNLTALTINRCLTVLNVLGKPPAFNNYGACTYHGWEVKIIPCGASFLYRAYNGLDVRTASTFEELQRQIFPELPFGALSQGAEPE